LDTKTARLVRTLRLRHLELLVVLSETTTMRDAATRLHLSQPAISKMLGEIERCFVARLFERSHQGITRMRWGRAPPSGLAPSAPSPRS
jgi:DNA-binding transcriptional LysR family regulator